MNSNFAENLKKIRKDNNLSQEQLADQLGVSRQSVSKWESSQTYPEMDKVLQICKMFNLNIDELLSQDIKEIKENKEEKNKINKYIDSFLSFITKSIDMFTNMKFKGKFKCLFEQVIIIAVLSILGLIIGAIGGWVVSSLFGSIPYKVYNVIFGVLEAIYFTIYIVFAFIILIHIFKTRYLDYYVMEKDTTRETIDSENENMEVDLKEKNESKDKEVFDKGKEKIIIRDPKHSEYKFINGLLKCCLFMVKCLSMFVFFIFACILIAAVICLVLSVYHIGVHSLFIGISLCSVSGIIVTILILIGLFDFIFSKKFYAKRIFIIFLISLAICGIGISSTFISCMSLNYKNKNYDNLDEIVEEFTYRDDLRINGLHNVYVFEVDNELKDTIKIKVDYNKDLYSISFNEENNYIFIDYENTFDNFVSAYKQLKKDLKDNVVYEYQTMVPEMTIISSENNIKNMINRFTKNTVSNLIVEENKYYLTLDISDSENTLCNIKYGYYNNCVYIDSDEDVIISDLFYDNNVLEYDENKYSCNKYDRKYYQCNTKELNEDE